MKLNEFLKIAKGFEGIVINEVDKNRDVKQKHLDEFILLDNHTDFSKSILNKCTELGIDNYVISEINIFGGRNIILYILNCE